MDTIMDMGNVTIGDIIPRADNGINGIILFYYINTNEPAFRYWR